MFDLSKVNSTKASEDGRWMIMRHPVTKEELVDDEGNVAKILLAGPDSKVMREAERKSIKRHLQSSGKIDKLDVDALMKERMELVISCTLGWENIGMDGQPLEFSKENARKLYETLPWLLDQAHDWSKDLANFLSN